MNYRKVFQFLSKGNKSPFDIPPNIQIEYLNNLPTPKNLIGRSYNQYLCQHFFVSKQKGVLLNIGAFFLTPFILVHLLLSRICCKRSTNVDAIGEFKGLEDIVPEYLSEKYSINNDVWREGFSISFSDFIYIKKLPLFSAPYFSLKIILKIAQYSHSIKKHSPQSFIVHNEYSFTSSALTDYCRQKQVMHINVMHGEKLLYIRDSWFEYDQCFVWSQHYVDLFKLLKAVEHQFVVALPPSMKIDTKLYADSSLYADYKYYLGNNSPEEIENIVRIMDSLLQNGRTYKIRLHPRYSDINIVKRYVAEDLIEYPSKVSIEESISNLEYAVGSYSTVLLQAMFSGKKILLDDVVYKHQFDMLKDLKYILANNNSQLSEICHLNQ